jgi:non-ribosomal peptide synthetase component F
MAWDIFALELWAPLLNGDQRPADERAILDRRPAVRHDLGADVGADISIVTPAPETQIYLLDDAHQVVPVGEVGQIATGGDGVALGYLDNAEETRKRFVTLPIGDAGTPG